MLDAEQEGLVFGRLDRTDGEVRYVGRIGVRDADYEPLVIDWRAPAAEPFYRATPNDPMHIIRRRVLHCRGERVVGIEDDLSTVRTLTKSWSSSAKARCSPHSPGPAITQCGTSSPPSRPSRMRRSAPYQGFTMINGGPGTGKTVVALHRAAYLLYSNRRRFESGGVLVVGPSRVFMDYIARVLPSLVRIRLPCARLVLSHPTSFGSPVITSTRPCCGDQGQPAHGEGAAPPGARATAGRPVRTADHGRWQSVGAAGHDTRAHPVPRARTPQAQQRREAAEKELLSALWQVGHPDAEDSPIVTTNVRTSTTAFRSRLVQDVLQRVVAGSQRSGGARPAGRCRAARANFDVGAVGRGVRAAQCELSGCDGLDRCRRCPAR